MKRTPLIRFIPFHLAPLVAPLLAAWPQQSRAGSAAWNVNAGGNWNAPANWNPNTTFPNSTTDVATINNDINAARIISLSAAAANITVNDLNLGDSNASHSFTIAPGTPATNTLIFGGTSPSFDIINGPVHTISAPLQFDANTAVRSQTANAHVLSGGLKDGGVARAITFNNDTNGVVRPPATVEGQFSVTTVAAGFNAGTTTTIDDVRVNINFAGVLGTAATNTVTMTGAGQLYPSAGTHVNNLVLNSTGWVENVGNLGAVRLENATVSGSVTLLQNTILGNFANNTGTLSGPVSGAFDITKVGGTTTAGQGVIQLSGNNAGWSGNLTVNRGTVRLNGAASQGTGTSILVDGSNIPVGTFTAGQLGAQLDLAGSASFGSGKTLTLRTGLLAQNYRATLLNQAGSNSWDGPIVLSSAEAGGSLAQINNNVASNTMTINGTVTGTGATYPGILFLRGSSNGVLSSSAVLNMPNTVFAKTDAGTWTVNSTGNNWLNTVIAFGGITIGATDALDTAGDLIMGQSGANSTATLDLQGFNQSVVGFRTDATATSTTSSIKNTGAAPSTLTFTTSGTDTYTGTVAGNTSLVKNGLGTFTLNSSSVAAPLMSGSLTVNAGTFNLTGATALGDATAVLTTAGNVSLGGEGSFGGNVTLGALTGLTTLAVDGASAGALTVGGTLTVNGTVPVSTSSGFSPTGTSRLINVPATPGGSGIAGFTTAGLGLRAPSVVFNALPTPGVDLTYTSVPLKWNAAGGAIWDVGTTASWQDTTPTTQSAMNGDALTLDDLPGANQTLAVSGTLMPGSVTFDNAAFSYTLTGTAGSNIATPIIKQNSGTAIIAYDNPSTQPATITAGTLQLGNGGATGVLNGPLANPSGALVFNHGTGASVTVPGVISGAGSVTKTGAGTTILTAVSTSIGTHTVSDGVLEVDRDTGNIVPATVDVLAPGTLRYSRNDAAFAFDRVVTGTGNVELNPHSAAGGTVAHSLTITSVNPGFTGTWVLPAPVTGTYRINAATPAAYGAGSIDVRSGAQVLAAAGTYTNNIAIAGTGFVDASANIGALRIEGVTWNGNVTVAVGGARIGAHNGTGTVGGNITGGPLEVNVSNYNNPYTVIFTGANSYTATTIGGGNTQTAGPPSMRLNIGNGGTTGSLGTGAVTLNGDGANGVLGFDRSDGYTLGAGNTITGGGTNLARTFIDFDTLGTGFAQNGVSIILGTPVAGAGGNLRLAVARDASITTFDGPVTAAVMHVGSSRPGTLHLNSGANVNVANLIVGAAALATGSVLNINTGSSLTAAGPDVGIGNAVGANTTVNHSGGTFTVGTVGAAARFRLGHFGTETSNYELTGGTLDLLGPAPGTTPSIPGNPEVSGGVCVGVDGTGSFNQSGSAIVNAHFVLLDARGAATANATPGEDQYNHNGGTLNLTSQWGIIARHPSSSRFTLNGGTVDNAAASGTAVMLDAPISVGAGGGTLDTSSASSSFVITGSVTGAGNTVNTTGGGKLTLQPNSKTVLDGVSNGLGTTTIEVNLTGDAGVEKIGTGITTLSGTNNYSGGTTVTAGTLVVNGSVTGTGTVASSGTLAGNGSLGAVTAASGSVVSPGLSVGALAFGSLDLQAGSRYDVEITAAATNDKVNVTGALTANGSIKVTLSGYVPVAGNTFDIADGTISGTPTFDFSAAVLTAGLVWDTTMFTSGGTISVILDDPFDAWASGFGLTEGKAGDDDKDGSSNLLEFATNSNPTTGGSGARAFGKLHPLGGDNVLTLTVAVRKSAVFAAAGSTQKATKDKVVYTVEASKDLANWTTIVVTELNPADSAALQATLTLPTLGSDWEWHSFRTQNGTLLNNLDMIRLSVAAE